MIIVPVKEGENIEKALKKFKRKFEKTGVIKELRNRQAFEKPSVTNRKKMMRAIYIQKLRTRNKKYFLFPSAIGIFNNFSYIRSVSKKLRVYADRIVFKIYPV